jgi:hypothetical protein
MVLTAGRLNTSGEGKQDQRRSNRSIWVLQAAQALRRGGDCHEAWSRCRCRPQYAAGDRPAVDLGGAVIDVNLAAPARRPARSGRASSKQSQGIPAHQSEPCTTRPLYDCSVHVVQVSPANRAECQQRIRIEALGQRLLRELPELDTRVQRDLHNGSEHRLRSADDIRRSKEPHSVNEPDQALFIAAQRDLVVGVSIQEQIRRADHKISINGLPFSDLRCDALIAILRPMRVNGASSEAPPPTRAPKSAETGLRRAGSMYMSPPKSAVCKAPIPRDMLVRCGRPTALVQFHLKTNFNYYLSVRQFAAILQWLYLFTQPVQHVCR